MAITESNTNKDNINVIHTDAVGENSEDASRIENLKFIFDTQHKWFWSLVDALTKGTAFYFAIIAALIGYILTKPMPTFVQKFLLIIGLSTSVLFFIATGAFGWLLSVCYRLLEKTLLSLNPDLSKELHLETFFLSIKKGLRVVAICSVLVFLTIIIGIFILLKQLPRIFAP
jgi:hypothetical protein